MDCWRRRSDALSIASWIRTAPRRIKSRASSTAISRSRIPLRAGPYRFYDDDDFESARESVVFSPPRGDIFSSSLSLCLLLLLLVVVVSAVRFGRTPKERDLCTRKKRERRETKKGCASSSSSSSSPILTLKKKIFLCLFFDTVLMRHFGEILL